MNKKRKPAFYEMYALSIERIYFKLSWAGSRIMVAYRIVKKKQKMILVVGTYIFHSFNNNKQTKCSQCTLHKSIMQIYHKLSSFILTSTIRISFPGIPILLVYIFILSFKLFYKYYHPIAKNVIRKAYTVYSKRKRYLKWNKL